jgi:capsular polysaccharide transport system permease protein
MGLLNSLQQQLADALIAMDLLAEVTEENDPRLILALRKIELIQARIAQERQKLVSSEGEGGNFSSLIGTFEALRVDLQFAEQSYISALSAYNTAVSDSRRKSIYLATYIEPTKAQRSEYPARITILALTGLFLFLAWAVLALVAYSIRDRR